MPNTVAHSPKDVHERRMPVAKKTLRDLKVLIGGIMSDDAGPEQE